MIKIENVDVYGWETAIRGMRNPMNSWSKTDSKFRTDSGSDKFSVGPNDLDLMEKLVRAGTDHSKFMRMITVTLDVTAPLYWWKEYDTYKVGTVRNSCSTMHKIHERNLTLDDFSTDHLLAGSLCALQSMLETINMWRCAYEESKDKTTWWQIIQLLPSSYNQRATIQLNYAVLRSLYKSRKNHKLDEWVEFCKWVETLPLAKELICQNNDEGETA